MRRAVHGAVRSFRKQMPIRLPSRNHAGSVLLSCKGDDVMDRNDVKRTIGQVADAADLLEIALLNARAVFEHEKCPEPHKRWDDMVVLAGLAVGEINCGGFGEDITAIIEQLEKL